ncbi:MAG: hypothetical protein JSR82_04830 [Verrucomicrobia bacterium]|nr:hypothetical protein [Verrucomicrobiota bacterium]
MIARTLAALAALALTGSAFAAEEYTNSVSGPITSIDANTIVLTQGKGKEKYVIRRDSKSQVDAKLKVGDVVKVEYYMTAVTAGPKPDKAEKKEKADKKKKDEAPAPAKEEKAADKPADKPAKESKKKK